jgi:hypothetical protein
MKFLPEYQQFNIVEKISQYAQTIDLIEKL